MNPRDKIDYLKKVEKKLMRIAKYCLIGIGCVFLFVLFAAQFGLGIFGIVGFLAAIFPWIFAALAAIILLVTAIATLIKYAISIFSYRINDRKNGADNLFVALLATLFLSFLIPMLLTAVTPSDSRSKARDARRLSDMRELVLAQEYYHNENSQYYLLDSMPAAIGDNMIEVPHDPTTSRAYGFINNLEAGDKFCYYAILENKKTNARGCADGCGFYSATQAGNFYLKNEPKTLDECINAEQNIPK